MNQRHTFSTRFFGKVSRKYLELALQSPYLMLAVGASLALSIASFYTTFIGMTDFTPWPIAALITMGVQVLLLITSWSIGFEMVKKGKASVVDSGIFAICLVTSVFFSFSALFDTIFDADLQVRTRMTRIHGAVERTINDLENISRVRREELVGTLLDSNGYTRWRKNVLAVSDAAAGAEDRLRQVLRDRAEQARSEIEELQRSVSDTAGEKDRLTARVASNTSEQKRLQHRQPLLVSKIASLQPRVAEAELAMRKKKTELDIEEKGGGPEGKRKSGRGPVWRKLNKQFLVLKEMAKGEQREMKSAEKELAQIDARIQSIAQQLAEDKTVLANFDTEMARRRQELGQAKSHLPSGGVEGLSNAVTVVQSLRNALSRFDRESDLGAFDQAASLCTDLLKEMNKIPQLRDTVVGLSCDRGGMTTLISAINQSTEDLRNLEHQCVAGGAEAQAVNGMDFENAVKYGRKCIGISGLPSDKIDNLREEIARLEREESPNASQFTKTSNALIAGEKLAYFALAIALAMDLLVLFTGIMGARTTRTKLIEGLDVNLDPQAHDSSEAKALKALLRHSDTVDGDVRKGRYEAQIDINDIDIDEGQANARLALMGMLGEHADEYPKRPGVYLLKTGTLVELRRELKQTTEKDDFLHGRQLHMSSHPAMEPSLDSGTGSSPYQDALASGKNDFFVYGDTPVGEPVQRKEFQHPGFETLGGGVASEDAGGGAYARPVGGTASADSVEKSSGPATGNSGGATQSRADAAEPTADGQPVHAEEEEEFDPMKMMEENMGGK